MFERKSEDTYGEDQFGFGRGKNARDGIGMLIIITKRTLEIGEELCTCFIYWQMAFYLVKWTTLLLIQK
jgi:hypothetical protein